MVQHCGKQVGGFYVLQDDNPLLYMCQYANYIVLSLYVIRALTRHMQCKLTGKVPAQPKSVRAIKADYSGLQLPASLPKRRSSEWGVMPGHWYWTSALPRALGAGLPLALLGAVLERRVRPAAACLAAYIALYSLLPHKEVGCAVPAAARLLLASSTLGTPESAACIAIAVSCV